MSSNPFARCHIRELNLWPNYQTAAHSATPYCICKVYLHTVDDLITISSRGKSFNKARNYVPAELGVYFTAVSKANMESLGVYVTSFSYITYYSLTSGKNLIHELKWYRSQLCRDFYRTICTSNLLSIGPARLVEVKPLFS